MAGIRWDILLSFTIWNVFWICSAADVDDFFPLLMPNVQPAVEETYICTPARLSDKETFYIVGFKPNATAHTAHHMLVYGCEDPGSEHDLWNCGEMTVKPPGLESFAPCKTGSHILYAWAKDAPNLELPKDVGFRVGADTAIKYLVLQVHYAHLDAIPQSGDDSGILVHFTNVPQAKSAGILLLGSAGMSPAHTTTFFETACLMEDQRQLHPFAFRVHTHSLGKVVSGWQVTDGNKWNLIGKQDPQLPQMFYPVSNKSMTINPGDIIAARCTMVNHNDHDTYIGPTNNDEMCNFYMMYWTHGKLPVTSRICFSQGPPHWSWKSWNLVNLPEEEASTL